VRSRVSGRKFPFPELLFCKTCCAGWIYSASVFQRPRVSLALYQLHRIPIQTGRERSQKSMRQAQTKEAARPRSAQREPSLWDREQDGVAGLQRQLSAILTGYRHSSDVNGQVDVAAILLVYRGINWRNPPSLP
jgi:hypothetical protein